jgi:hypothetical protein
MGTLETKGITWSYLTYNNRIAFGYNHHAIVYDNSFYHLKENGRSIFKGSQVHECLEVSSMVLDYYANKIVTSWE